MDIPRSLGTKTTTRFTHVAVYLILTLGAVTFVFPLYWMFSTSLKTIPELFAYPVKWWPDVPQWINYTRAFQLRPFDIYLRNTLVIVILSALGDVLACSFVAYGFARLNFPGRDFLFILLLSTMMLPGIVKLVPLYVMFHRMGWVNTFLPLVVPSWFGSAFYIFLLRQFFMTIPEELADAGRIDGASEFAIWRSIMLPLSGPALAVIGIFSLQHNWNDFLQPLIYLTTAQRKTLALGLYELRTAPQEDVSFHLLMAASTIMVIPMIVLFAAFQRYFIQGITLTGIKG